MCAQRPDRSETVVPVLAGYNARSREVIDDHLAYVEATSNFHQSLLTLCGNQTMEIIAGSVEMLWLSHVQEWAELTHRDGTSPPTDYRVEGIEVHEAITSLIKAGAVSEVMAVVRGHFNPKQFQRPDSVEDALIQASMLRSPGRVFAPASSRSGK
jgi:DNA-binding GntR family transcriptional regulator